ncbi:MAG TPA: methylated-DNA--[protein]-cysteine S-methyltransferase [bacterium]|nr:methylated-DNA--[protein]-cysteine S-methyltransferase [bacterium]
MALAFLTTPSPLGPLDLFADDASGALIALYFARHRHRPALEARENARLPVLAAATEQLREYFSGTRTRFDLTLAPRGTAFQRRVWDALREIPHGGTTTYGALADAIGSPRAVRAVGAANGRNPLSIVVPCHRVVGANGTLTGYAGGLDAKRWLLDHEARFAPQPALAAPPSSR